METWYKVTFNDGAGHICPVNVAKSNSYIVWVVGDDGETKKYPKSGLKEFYFQSKAKAEEKLQQLFEGV